MHCLLSTRGSQTTTPLLCPDCSRHANRKRAKRKTRKGLKPSAYLLGLCTWEPAWESEDSLVKQGYQEMLDAFKQNMQTNKLGGKRMAAPDMHLSSMERQVHADCQKTDVFSNNDIRTKLTVHTDTVNPHLDIHPHRRDQAGNKGSTHLGPHH